MYTKESLASSNKIASNWNSSCLRHIVYKLEDEKFNFVLNSAFFQVIDVGQFPACISLQPKKNPLLYKIGNNIWVCCLKIRLPDLSKKFM